jgi:hypothetical protein
LPEAACIDAGGPALGPVDDSEQDNNSTENAVHGEIIAVLRSLLMLLAPCQG